MNLHQLAGCRLEINARIITDAPNNKPSSKGGKSGQPASRSPHALPEIVMSGPGRLVSSIATELGAILKDHPFFNYVGRAAYLDSSSQQLDPLTPEHLRTLVETYVVPVKVSATGRRDPHSLSAAQARSLMLSPPLLSQLRPVVRFSTTRFPSIGADGKLVLQKEGYDPELRSLTAASPAIDTKLSTAAAKKFLDDLLREFPFNDNGRSKAAALSAMLTLFGQKLLPSGSVTPVFLYEANRPGAGKGLLANAAIIPVLGHPLTGVKPREENEMRKLLLAAAREDQPVFFLDNVDREIASPSLESFITTSTVTGRVLGATRILTARKSTVVLITANGGKLSADMSRRTITCSLHLKSENRVIANPLDENGLLRLRAPILSALYALIRNWDQHSRPKPARVNFNFVPWSETIGGVLEINGYTLPY